MDKGIDPVGLHIGMQKIYHRYRLPMIVTENGMAYSDKVEKDGTIHDEYRIDYLKKHIEQLKIMIDEGIPYWDTVHGVLLMLYPVIRDFRRDMD